MNLIKQIEVMKAALLGKDIESHMKAEADNKWTILTEQPQWNWSDFDYQVVKNWTDCIPTQGVVCWVTGIDLDGNQTDKCLRIITKFVFCSKRPYKTNEGGSWEHAVPLTQEELLPYIQIKHDNHH